VAQVKHGNWVEDTLAFERINDPPPVYKNYQTEQMAGYSQTYQLDPAEREKRARQTADLKAKNKDGQSYVTLFEHGGYKNEFEVPTFSALDFYLL
jgi:hypothetical protein